MTRLSDYIAIQQGLPEAPVGGQVYGRRGSDNSWVAVLTQTIADGLYAPTVHNHTLSQVTDSGSLAAVDDAPSDGDAYGRLNNNWTAVITEAVADIRYAPNSHTHPLSQITDSGSMAAVNDAPQDGSQYARQNGNWAVVLAAGGTDLGNSRSSTSVTVTSSTGSNTTLSAATTSLAGVMTASDKSKLIDPGTSSGQTMYWNGSAWSPTTVFRVTSTTRATILFGTSSSTWPLAIGSNTKVEGSFEATSDISCLGSFFGSNNITVNGFVTSDQLTGTGNRNVECTSSGALVAGSAAVALVEKSDMALLINTLLSEGAISPSAAGILTTAFTP